MKGDIKKRVSRAVIEYEIDDDDSDILIAKSGGIAWSFDIILIDDVEMVSSCEGDLSSPSIRKLFKVKRESEALELQTALVDHGNQFLRSARYRELLKIDCVDTITSMIQCNSFDLDEIVNLVKVKMVMES